jgi:hypothetical protein
MSSTSRPRSVRSVASFVSALAAVATIALLATTAAEAATPVLSLDPAAVLTADRAGATITGTVVCEAGDTFLIYGANVFQVVGRVAVSASSSSAVSVPCTGAPEHFSVTVHTFYNESTLAPGRASVGLTGLTDTSEFGAINTVVRLKP